MSVQPADMQALFCEALEKESDEELHGFLEGLGNDDPGLRVQLEQLLESHREAGNFLGGTASVAIGRDRAASERLGTRIDEYTLLEQIGEGGMGVVYLAEQAVPVKRKVALKVIKPGMDSRQVIARFESEKQALALMDHINIARVLDAGTTGEGRPYFVMELVHGAPITTYCDEHRLTTRQRLELFVSTCQAIQHAHQKGIIHRDIKPSNVMVTLHEDKPIPKIIDFGVAKATEQQLTEQSMCTGLGQIIGTLEYMSPEQAQMDRDVDTRSDIYSLGVLLYELLTGSTPVRKEQLETAAFDELRRIIRDDEPQRPSARISSAAALHQIAAQRHTDPSRLSRIVSGELDWIVLKCLDKDRNRRYETASDLAADVGRYLSDDPVWACPPSAWYRFRKFARRNKAALATTTIVCVAVVLAVAALTTSTIQIASQERLTASALRAETLAYSKLEEDSYFHRIALIHRELSADNLGRALQLLDDCPERLRDWEWRYLTRLCRLEPIVIEHNAEVNSLDFSSDGELLVSGCGDGTIKIWNRKLEQVAQLANAHPGEVAGHVSSVAFHGGDQHVASVGGDKKIKVWEWATGRSVFEGRCDATQEYGSAYAVCFSPDGRQLAAGTDGAVQLWNWKNKGDQPILLAGHAKRGITVAYSPDQKRVATGSWSGEVMLWDARSGQHLLTLSDYRHPVTALAFSPDSDSLVGANFDGRLIVWNAVSGQVHQTLKAHGGLVMCVAYSPDGRRIASAALDKTVRIWDSATGREVLVLRGHTGQCGCVAFSPDGQRLASSSKDGTIRIWDATPLDGHEGQEMNSFRQHSNEIWSLAVSPDGDQVVTGGFSAPAKVWDSNTGAITAQFPSHANVVFGLAWQPNGPTGSRRIASAGADGALFTVKVWDSETESEVFELPGVRPGDPEFFALAFSPNGKILVTGQADGTVKVWDAMSGAYRSTLANHSRPIRAVVFSPDGRRLASASADGLVQLWDAAGLDQKQEPKSIRARVPAQCQNVAFSVDGLLATGGEDNTVKIWDLETLQVLHTLRGHNGDIHTVAFSPDGRLLASAGEDSTVKIWSSRTGGSPIRSFRGHFGLVSSVAFTPDGQRLISGSRDHFAKVWDISSFYPMPEGPASEARP